MFFIVKNCNRRFFLIDFFKINGIYDYVRQEVMREYK